MNSEEHEFGARQSINNPAMPSRTTQLDIHPSPAARHLLRPQSKHLRVQSLGFRRGFIPRGEAVKTSPKLSRSRTKRTTGRTDGRSVGRSVSQSVSGPASRSTRWSRLRSIRLRTNGWTDGRIQLTLLSLSDLNGGIP